MSETNKKETGIKQMQDLARSGAMQDMLTNVLRLRTQLDMAIENIGRAVSSEKAEEARSVEAEVKKPEEETTSIAKDKPFAEKPAYIPRAERPDGSKPPFERRPFTPTAGGTRSRQFDPNAPRRNFGDRPPYDPNAPRRPYDPNARGGDRPPFGPRPAGAGYGPRPGGPGGFKPRPQNTPYTPMAELPTAAGKKGGPVKKKSDKPGADEKKTMNKRSLLMRGFIEDETLGEGETDERAISVRRYKKIKEVPIFVAPSVEKAIITTDNLTVKMLAEKIGKPVVELIQKFLLLGMMVTINSNIDYAAAELIAGEFGIELEQKLDKSFEEKLSDLHDAETDNEKDLVKRPAVVTVMGHVDHGKTSLLDAIRETNVTKGEAGGITQHIGSYTIIKNGEKITFIDTPGHAAFTAMRERGAKLADIAILIVAADDSVMPQTIEAIKHIKEANVPMIVAINKIDKQAANIEKVKTMLSEYGVVPEEWGGDAIMVPISALTGENIDKLLEMILFVAEYQNLRANPKRKARGVVIEAALDKGRGPVATVLVQNGTLKIGDTLVAGVATGKVRAMNSYRGNVKKAITPGIAIQVLGLSSVPKAGDPVFVVDEKMGKHVVSERKNLEKVSKIKSADLSVESIMDKMKETEFKHFNVIVKGDVQGSVEALQSSLKEIQNEEVKVKCIHGGVGGINENDVMLASTSGALVVAFNVKTDFKAKVLADKYKVEIVNSKIIYEVIDLVTKRINKMLTPKYKEVITGHAEIRALFKASKIGLIAGCMITDGKIARNSKARVLRNGQTIYEGSIGSLQREKNEAKEVASGFECGITLDKFNEIAIGDIIEAYGLERIN